MDSAPETGTVDLLRKLAAEPELAWPALVARTDAKLRTLARFRGGDGAPIDDLLQEVWVEAARKLSSFEYRGPGSLHRWLAAILRHKLLHARSEAGRRAAAHEGAAHPPAARDWRGGVLESVGVSRSARQRELEERVHVVLARLAPSLREVLLLRIYEGLTGAETAVRLEVDESTVARRFRQALEESGRGLRDWS